MVRQELQFESSKEKFALLILAIHNEGEKNTKYFLNLEKRHYKSSVITQFKPKKNLKPKPRKETLQKQCNHSIQGE